jgi:GH18 family chitinase
MTSIRYCLFFILFVITLSQAQISQPSMPVVAYYSIWSYCDMPPQKVDYSAITHLIVFGGASSGITPDVSTSPYFPPAIAGRSCFSTTFNGTPGWCGSSYSGKVQMQVMRDSCTKHGVKLLLDLGGEWGSPATAFGNLIADPAKFDPYINAVDSICQRNIYGVKFDGVSIDWEFPTNSAQGRTNYAQFLDKLRAKLDTPGRRRAVSGRCWGWRCRRGTGGMGRIRPRLSMRPRWRRMWT